MKKGQIVTVYTVKILLSYFPSPHFSAKSFLNYEILSDVFLQCVLNRVLDYSEFPLLVFRNILKVKYCFFHSMIM